MKRNHFNPTRRAVMLLALLSLTLVSTTVRADDAGSWVSVQLNKGWEHSYAFGRAEHRSNNQFSSTEAMFLVAGGGYKIKPWLKADASYEYWRIGNTSDVHKLVLCGTGTLARDGLAVSLREKLELAYNPLVGSVSPTLRSRLRAQYTVPDHKFNPYMMAEVFSWKGWIRSLNYVGAEIPITRQHIIDVFYMYHLPAGSQPVHVVGLGYVFNF